MANWITLFEKYRVERRLLKIHLNELNALSEHSPKRPALQATVNQILQNLHGAECILSRYGDDASTAKEAIQRADERLFMAFHYVRGLTMEDTAREMCMSRDSVYRIRRRVISRGEIPEAFIEDARIASVVGFENKDFPIEPRRNVLLACFAGAPGGISDSLLSACP